MSLADQYELDWQHMLATTQAALDRVHTFPLEKNT